MINTLCMIVSSATSLLVSPVYDAKTVLCRASIVAGRASVLVTTNNPRQETVDLTKTLCDGPSDDRVAVATIDLDAPRYQIVNRFNTQLSRGLRAYPEVLLRHSHSRHGLFVVNYKIWFNTDDDYWVNLMSSSIPHLEDANQLLTAHARTNSRKAWDNFLADQCVGPDFEPLERRPAPPPVPGKPVGRGAGAIFYDFFVTNAADCELYVAALDGEVECHVNSVLPSRKTTVPGGGEGVPWEKRHTVPGDINGPFAVVPHKKARYLVTPAGAVARMVNAGGDAEQKLVTVYDKSKVLAVVHDTDEEKRYAFTATHFFEVAEPVVLKPHAVKKFDTSNGAAGLETAFHCGRAVRGLPPLPFPTPPK